MKKLAIFCIVAFSFALISTSVGFAQSSPDYSANGKKLFSKSWIWSPIPTQMIDTSKFKKKPPYVIGFSNASVSNSWRVQFVNEFKAECDRHKDLIKAVYITDAQDKPTKQVADIEDLMTKNLDILVVAASESGPLDPIVSKIYKSGFPVAMIDRRITSENFVNFTTCSDIVGGRLSGLWLAEVLKGKGNIVCLPGGAGASPAEDRLAGAKEIFSQFPDIKILDVQYTSWSPAEGKRIMSALIQSYGKKIDGVWADSGLQGSGAIEALIAAGMKIPVTGEDNNAFLLLVQKNKWQAMSNGYTPKYGSLAVKNALNILQGIPVPRIVNATRTVLTTVDTADIKGEIPWDKMAKPGWPLDFWMDNNLPPEMLPK
jgi:ribose transport system substrate-binding protein